MNSILRISEASLLAMHGMVFLVHKPKDELVSVKDMAYALGVSEHHLSKVFQRMTKAGLVKSVRGPRGGFLLARPAVEIRLIDILTAIEGDFEPKDCLFSKKLCQNNGCILGELVVDINKQILRYLKKKKLSDFRNIYRKEIFITQGQLKDYKNR